MLHSLSIAKKIWLSLSILVLGYSVMTISGFAVGQKRVSRLKGVSEYLFPASQLGQLALSTFNEQIKSYESAIMLGDESLMADAQGKANEVKKVLQTIIGLPEIDAQITNDVQETIEQFDKFTVSAQAFYTGMSSRLTLSASEEGDMDSYENESKRLAQTTEDLEKKLTSLTQVFAHDLKAELTDISSTTQDFWNMNMLTFLIVVFGTLFLVAIFIIRSIISPIKGVIKGVTGSSSQLSSASVEISQASQRLAEGANQQASGLEESSSSLEEMSVMTKQNADNARQASTLAVGTREAAEKGMETMQRMSKAIEDIKNSSDETAKIIKTIDEIAFQTNLLALNAAVEAARAGEAGKGFAVVAEEVRNLAQRSAEAARNTTSLIDKSKNNSDSGVTVSQEVGAILEEIVGSARKVTNLVGEVAAASEEQSKGIDQVNDAVAQMNKTTQENASNAEESASASEELNAQGVQLNNMIAELVALVGGSSNNNLTGGSTIKVAGGHKQVKHKGSGESIHDVDHEGERQSKETRTVRNTKTDTRIVSPEEIIPLDNGDFKDF